MNTSKRFYTITTTGKAGVAEWTHFGTQAELISKMLWGYDEAPLDCTLDEAIEYLLSDYQKVAVTSCTRPTGKE